MDTKALVISHRSGIECLDLYSPLLEAHAGWLPTKSRETLDVYGFDASTLERVEALRLPSPVEILVPSSAGKRPPEGIIFHGFSAPLLREDLIQIEEGIFVCVPELAATQVVSRMSRPMAATIIDQLVSTYRMLRKTAVSPYEQSFPLKHLHVLTASDGTTRLAATIYGLDPQTSLKQLERYASLRHDIFGIRRLRESLPLCAVGLRSPLEAQDYLLLFAPRRLGGYGLKPPLVNKSVRLNSKAREVAGIDVLTPDFLWQDERVVVEVLGKADHEGSDLRIGDTSIRERVWRSMNYSVFTHTSREIHKPDLLKTCAKELAGELGTRLRSDVKDYEARQRWLRQEVMRNGNDTRRSLRSYKELLEDENGWLSTFD